MQLLTEISDVNELARLRMLFESNGIAIYISNEDSARNFGVILPARKYGIFVVYENQLEDARALLTDENHIVRNPLDIEQYREQLAQLEPATEQKVFKAIIYVFLFLVALITALAWINS